MFLAPSSAMNSPMDQEKQEPDSPKKQHSLADSSESSAESPLDKRPSPSDVEALQKEFQELVDKKFGGQVQVMSMDNPFESGGGPQPQEEEVATTEALSSIADFDYKPKDIKKYLDRFVVGQDEAKKALSIAICDHYNHLQASLKGGSATVNHYQKQNVMIMGPTGVGKTYLVRLISDLIGVPFVKVDATRFSEVGYMGANVDDVIRDLVQVADGNTELAAKGIVYVDEVDKLASRRDHTGRDVSGRGVQFGFLRLLEDTDVDLNSSHDIASQFKTFMNFQKKGKAEKEIVNTRDILFIFSGAFHGLEDIINNRLNKKAIGLHQSKESEDISMVLKKAEAKDLVDFGFEHEFIGRLPVRVACDSLGVDDLFEILTATEHSILKQYQKSFEHYGITLKFQEKALKLISEKAHGQKTGARGLSAVCETLLRPFKFELPSTAIDRLDIDESLVKNPKGALHHLLNQ